MCDLGSARFGRKHCRESFCSPPHSALVFVACFELGLSGLVFVPAASSLDTSRGGSFVVKRVPKGLACLLGNTRTLTEREVIE